MAPMVDEETYRRDRVRHDSGALADQLWRATAAAITSEPPPDPKGIGRRAPTTPLDVCRLVGSGALTTTP